MYQQIGDLIPGSGSHRTASRTSGLLDELRCDTRSQRLKQKAVRYARQLSIGAAMRLAPKMDTRLLNRAYAVLQLSWVYIGGLSSDITKADLYQLLGTCGPISFVNLPKDAKQEEFKNRGYAFVHFMLPEAALLAISTLNCVTLRDSPMRVGRPSNMANSGALLEALAAECPDLSCRLYLANVPQRVTDADLRAALSAYGRLASAELQADSSRPGQHRGFGFARYCDPSAATAAMNCIGGGGGGGPGALSQLRVGRVVAPPDVPSCFYALPPSPVPPPAALAVASAALMLGGSGVADANVMLESSSDEDEADSGMRVVDSSVAGCRGGNLRDPLVAA